MRKRFWLALGLLLVGSVWAGQQSLGVSVTAGTNEYASQSAAFLYYVDSNGAFRQVIGSTDGKLPVTSSPTAATGTATVAPRSNFAFITLTASASWQAQALSATTGSSNRILFSNQGSGVLQWWVDKAAANPPAAFNGFPMAVSSTPIQIDDVPVSSVLHWKSDASTTGLLINWY